MSSSKVRSDALVGANARMMVPGPEYALLRRWVGDWDVRMRLWTSAAASATELPPMVARRTVVQDAFLCEIMEPAPGSAQEPFTRTCYLSFNNLRRRYEYIGMDSRAPGMMFETSLDDVLEAPGTITVYLEAFPMAGWGDDVTGVLVAQRRTLETVDADTMISRQYWRLPAAEPFLAVEYVYTRTPHRS